MAKQPALLETAYVNLNQAIAAINTIIHTETNYKIVDSLVIIRTNLRTGRDGLNNVRRKYGD